jgi:outer membrane lipoprotein SlyB
MKTPMIQEILALVTFNRDANGNLVINDVFGHVSGSVMGNVRGNVIGDVQGKVKGTINGCKWKFIETPKEKVIRLIREGKGDEAIQALQESKL